MTLRRVPPVDAATLRRALRALGMGAAIVATLTGCGRTADETAAPATASRSTPTAAAGNPALIAIDAPFPDIALHLLEIRRVKGTKEGEREALIDVASRRSSYRVGQELFPGVVVEAIETEQVQLRFRARSRTLYLLDGKPTASTPPTAAEAPAATADATDVREQNRHIDVTRLTAQRPLAADAFLREVRVEPNPRGGFVVEDVLADSRYALMGLRRGDVIHSLDSPEAAVVDERSMVSLVQQTELVLNVSRAGHPLTLRHALNIDPADTAETR